MALFGFFEKKYSDWSMDTGEGARADFRKKMLEKGLEDVCKGVEEFLILTAKESFPVSARGRVGTFIQAIREDDSSALHLEISTQDQKNPDDTIIYGKDGVSAEEALEIFMRLLDENQAPDLAAWNPVMCWRNPVNPEAYQRLTNAMTAKISLQKELKWAFHNPYEYVVEKADRFAEREIDRDAPLDEILFFGLVDEFLEAGEMLELDWKEDKEEFLGQMQELAEHFSLPLEEDWLEPEADIPTWCKALDEHWEEVGFVVAGLDIDSDSYLLFPAAADKMQLLTDLAAEIGHEIKLGRDL